MGNRNRISNPGKKKPGSTKSQEGGGEVDLPSGGANFETYIETSILDKTTGVAFKDVVGHEKAKEALREIVIYPNLRSVSSRSNAYSWMDEAIKSCDGARSGWT